LFFVPFTQLAIMPRERHRFVSRNVSLSDENAPTGFVILCIMVFQESVFAERYAGRKPECPWGLDSLVPLEGVVSQSVSDKMLYEGAAFFSIDRLLCWVS